MRVVHKSMPYKYMYMHNFCNRFEPGKHQKNRDVKRYISVPRMALYGTAWIILRFQGVFSIRMYLSHQTEIEYPTWTIRIIIYVYNSRRQTEYILIPHEHTYIHTHIHVDRRCQEVDVTILYAYMYWILTVYVYVVHLKVIQLQ